MGVLNILFVGGDEVARSIAKKSDSRDVDNYIYKDFSSTRTNRCPSATGNPER